MTWSGACLLSLVVCELLVCVLNNGFDQLVPRDAMLQQWRHTERRSFYRGHSVSNGGVTFYLAPLLDSCHHLLFGCKHYLTSFVYLALALVQHHYLLGLRIKIMSHFYLSISTWLFFSTSWNIKQMEIYKTKYKKRETGICSSSGYHWVG